MFLLNVTSGELEHFDSAANIPQYAILSHTWGDNEVTYRDLIQLQESLLPRGIPFVSSLIKEAESRPSYSKIRYARTQAQRDGYQYLWADTCCIDKSSSAELSEAINSMYRYYQESAVCYAYLEDAPEDFPHKKVEEAETDLGDLTGRKFVSCRWFTRGWTLQELLAPRKVIFYGGKDWRRLGSKDSLADWLVLATGIDRELLLDPTQLSKISVARKMSFSSKRQTTRIEDVAYCLLGIFGVNMPLLYGEGENAFFRLQEEIMKFSDDQSLFAWKASPDDVASKAYGIFARHPKLFAESGNVVPISSERLTAPFTMTNRGLQIDLPIIPVNPDHLTESDDREYLGLLDCQYEDDYTTCLSITLRQTHVPRVMVRLEGNACSLQKVTPKDADKAEVKTLFIPREFIPLKRTYMNCQVQSRTLGEHGFALIKVLRPPSQSRSRWNPETQVMRIEAAHTSGAHEFLPHATFIFRNTISGLGFAVRLDLHAIDETNCVRISRLREHAWDFAFLHQRNLANGSLRAGPEAARSREDFRRHSRNISSETPQKDIWMQRMLSESQVLRSDLLRMRQGYFFAFDQFPDVNSMEETVENLESEDISLETKENFKSVLSAFANNKASLKRSMVPFLDEWYSFLERDAELSRPSWTSSLNQDLNDGSQLNMKISAKLRRQNIFNQTLHVLTVEMEHFRHFEMGG